MRSHSLRFLTTVLLIILVVDTLGSSLGARERRIGYQAVMVVNQPAAQPQANTPPQVQPKPGFNGNADLVDSVTIATGVSPDKQAMTVLFRNLQADVDPVKGGPLVDVKTSSVLLPLEKTDKDMPLTIDIRGFAELHNCTATLFVLPSGGIPVCFPIARNSNNLAPEINDNTKKSREAAGRQSKQTPRLDRDATNGGHDFFYRVAGFVKAGSSAKVTLILTVDREFSNSSAGGLIEIDSMDVSLTSSVPSPPDAPVPTPPSGDAPHPAK